MKFGGYRQVKIGSIVAPGDVLKRQKTDGVKGLVHSIGDLGNEPMHAITARATDRGWEIIAGRDRYSALQVLKAKTAWIHVVLDASDVELLKAEVHENLHRRHDDKAALTARLVDKAEGVLTRHVSRKSEEPPGHRPEGSRGAARRLVAEASGETVEAVTRRDQRAAAGARQIPIALPPIDLHGHELPTHMADVAPLCKQIDKCDQLLRNAKAAITELTMFASCPPGVVEALRRSLDEATSRLRTEKPAHLCPKCNGTAAPTTGATCKTCKERGWVTDAAYNAAPREQRTATVKTTRKEVRVVYEGEEMTAEEAERRAGGGQ